MSDNQPEHGAHSSPDIHRGRLDIAQNLRSGMLRKLNELYRDAVQSDIKNAGHRSLAAKFTTYGRQELGNLTSDRLLLTPGRNNAAPVGYFKEVLLYYPTHSIFIEEHLKQLDNGEIASVHERTLVMAKVLTTSDTDELWCITENSVLLMPAYVDVTDFLGVRQVGGELIFELRVDEESPAVEVDDIAHLTLLSEMIAKYRLDTQKYNEPLF